MAPDIRSIFAQAVGHHQAGRWDEAVACYRRLLALDPNLASGHYNLANALFALGNLPEAEASYRRALGLQPGLANAHNNLGILLDQKNQLDEAAACYRQALALEPDYAEALNNLGAALCRQGALDEGEASIRRALSLKPDFAGAHDNLGTVLWEQGRREEALASVRQAVALQPDFARAQDNLAGMLRAQGRLDEAIAAYRQVLRIKPEDLDGLNGLASALAAKGMVANALATVLQSLQIRETAKARRIFANVARQIRWTGDNRLARQAMARALTMPWARPDELARTAASLVKQDAKIGEGVARAAAAWPGSLPAPELFGPGGPKHLAEDGLLLALLDSAQNTDVELERFFTMARRALLEEAAGDGADAPDLEFNAALARQCFINEYVFFHGSDEIRQAQGLRDGLVAALEAGSPVPSLRLLAVAAYFPLHSLCGASRLLERTWPAPISAVLAQQLREPQEEARLRALIPRLTPIEDRISRLVQSQYEDNPYPRWVRMPPVETATSIGKYLRQKFPLAVFQQGGGGETAEFLSAGCGTGQLALEIAQGVAAGVLAIDLSLSSLGYARRKALELGLDKIEFAQADLLELPRLGKSFDVIESSGVLHHLADPFAGWRVLLSLLRPGGFMLVGLYSDMARQGIVEARQFIARQGYGTSADDIRRCRQDLLSLDRERVLGTSFGDFFGVSSCRDLLFHVQEQRMRLPAIAAFLKDNDLNFLGFEIDSATLDAYERRFPDDPAAANLDHWDAFENDNPDTFARMYVFWVQKNGAP